MKDIVKLGVILFVITAMCAGLLGLVNSITQPIILEKKEISIQESLKVLVPEAKSFMVIDEIDSDSIKKLYIAQESEDYVGVVANVMSEGYGGIIEILVGVDKEEKITGIQILSHMETPGLGANLASENFRGQFVGKKANIQVVKGNMSDNDISAITGATITSQAVTDSVNKVIEYINIHQRELMGGVK